MGLTQQTSLRIYPQPLQSLSYLLISTIYINIGLPLQWPARIFMLQNTMNVDVVISWDGTTDHQYIPSNGFVLIDVTANKSSSQQAWYVSAGTTFYAKVNVGSAPASGNVYLTVFYGLVEGS
jgi:hypothetical protein